MELKRRKRKFKVNDQRIKLNKYYPWYYTESLKINLVPISYYTREQALLTLIEQFGRKEVLNNIKIIKGSLAIKEGFTLGKNSYKVNGKHFQVKKYLIPPEYKYNRSRRRKYAKKLRNNKIETLNKLNGRLH